MKVQHIFYWPVKGCEYHKLNVIADDGTTASVIVPNPTGKITVAQAINTASQQGPALLKEKQRQNAITAGIEGMTKAVDAVQMEPTEKQLIAAEMLASMKAIAEKPATMGVK